MTGVFPVYSNKFKIGTNGVASSPEQMLTIADMETFSVAIDNGVEEWHPMETEGWVRRLMTAKGFTISLNGKRNFGDKGNDYVAGLAFKNGQETYTKFEWELPSGAKVTANVVVSVNTLGGDSTNADALEIELSSDGKPTFEAAPIV